MSLTYYVVTDASDAVLREYASDDAGFDPGVGVGETLHTVPAPAPLPLGAGYIVTFDGDAFVQTVASLESLRAQRWAEIKAQRESLIANAGATAGGDFETTPAGLLNLASVAVLLLANPSITEIEFTLVDNTRPEFTRAEFLTAASDIGAAVQALHAQAHALRLDLDAATTAAELLAIEWPT